MFKLNWTFSSFFCSQKSYNFFGSNLLFPNPTIWTKFSSTQLFQSKPLKEYLITKFVFQYTILSCGLYSHSHNFRLKAKIMWLYSHSYTFVLVSLRPYNPDNSETYPESTMLRFRANMSPPNNQRAIWPLRHNGLTGKTPTHAALRKYAKSGKYSHSDKTSKHFETLLTWTSECFRRYTTSHWRRTTVYRRISSVTTTPFLRLYKSVYPFQLAK